MFRSSYQTKVDDKGRLKLPVEHKRWADERYGAEFFITTRDGRRAELYPMEEWRQVEQEIGSQPNSAALNKILDRVNYYGQTITMDAQGRLLIPQALREKANLKGDVAVLGKLHRMDVVNNAEFLARMDADAVTDDDMGAVNIRAFKG